MDRSVTMARFDEREPDDWVEDCASCQQTIKVDDAYGSRDYKFFCSYDCACEYFSENIDSYIDALLD